MSFLSQEPDQTAFHIAVVANALYGAIGGWLMQREFSILKAVAIPIIPAGVVTVLAIIVIRLTEEPVLAAERLQEDAKLVGGSSVQGIVVAWLAFWLHSKWGRK